MLLCKRHLGLDLGEHQIKLIQVLKKRGRVIVTAHGSIDTPPGTISGGLITDPDKLGAELGLLVQDLKLEGHEVVAAVSGQQVFTKLLTLPPMKHQDLRQAAFFQASSFLPISIDEVTSDIVPGQQVEDDEGIKTELLFVAARRTQVDNLYLTCKAAGLNLAAVEIEPLALQRVYAPDLKQGHTVAILNIGGARTYLAVYSHAILAYVRTISFGLDTAHQELAELPRDAEPTPPQPEVAATLAPGTVHPLAGLVPEINRSLDYFELQNKGEPLGKIIVCGGGSRIQGVVDYLSQALEQPVELGQPAPQILLSRNLDQEARATIHHQFPVALGLAMRGGKAGRGATTVPIDLLSYKFAEQRATRAARREYLAYGLILLLLASGAWGYNLQQRNQIALLQRDTNQLEQEVEQLKALQPPGAGDGLEELGPQQKLVEKLSRDPKLIDPQFLEFIHHTGGPDITISKISTDGDVLSISAYTNSQAAMLAFTEKFKESPLIRDIQTVSTKLNEKTGEVDFSLTLRWETDENGD